MKMSKMQKEFMARYDAMADDLCAKMAKEFAEKFICQLKALLLEKGMRNE